MARRGAVREGDAARWGTRGADLRADLEASWDGRPLSELEHTEWQIAKARRAGDQATVDGLLDLRRALELE